MNNTPSKKKSTQIWIGIISWGIVIILVAIVWAWIAGSINKGEALDEQERNAQAQELEAISANRQPVIDKYAPLFCSTHQTTKTTFENTSYPSNDGSGWTNEECIHVTGILYDQGTDEQEMNNIVNSKIWVGMSGTELWYSIGNPNDINTSNYGGDNVSQQLVYGSNYVYLDSNNTVTSYQMY